jgi:hypothetical protein
MLAGCAGGGGGGVSANGAAAALPPFTIGAPDAGTVGANTARTLASTNGPSFSGVGGTLTVPAATDFPLQQSAMTVGTSSVAADATIEQQGAILTVTHEDPTTHALSLSLTIPALSLSHTALTDEGVLADGTGTPPEVYKATLAGGKTLELDLAHLDYVAAGVWSVYTTPTVAGLDSVSGVVTGYRTANLAGVSALIPDLESGSPIIATYTGATRGVVAIPATSGWAQAVLTGTISLSANFTTDTLSGSINGLQANPVAGGAAQSWNTVQIAGTISEPTTSFTGSTTTAAVSGGGSFALAGTATGHLDGAFYGPIGQEVGGVWTLSDGTKSALGVFGAESDTSGDSGGVTIVTAPPSPVDTTATLVGPATATGPVFTALNTGQVATPATLPADNSAFTLSLDAHGQDGSQDPDVQGDGALIISHVDPSTGKPTLLISIPGVGITSVSIGSPPPISGYPLKDTGVSDAGAGLGGEVYTSSIGTVTLYHLDYLAYGLWEGNRVASGFAGGYATPVGGLPTTGSASFAGKTYGQVSVPCCGAGFLVAGLQGDANLTVNFASGQITGALTNMKANAGPTATAAPWDDISITATLSGVTFAGTTAVSTAAGGQFSLGAGATGAIKGGLYGPTGQELGAVWSIGNGTGGAVGAIGATKH